MESYKLLIAFDAMEEFAERKRAQRVRTMRASGGLLPRSLAVGATRRAVTVSLLLVVMLLLAVIAATVAPVAGSAMDATPKASSPSAASSDFSGLVDIGGRSLYLDCQGEGSPTVIFEAGQGVPRAALLSMQNELAKTTLACTYDRANRGASGSAPTPRTAADVVADLHALLTTAAVPAPYVLVGHSAGGQFVQLYARTHPEETVGVIAINPVPPAHPWLDDALPLMTEQERAEEEAYFRAECCDNGEAFDWNSSSAQLAAAPPPPDVPFALLLSTIAQCESPTDVCGRTYALYETIEQGVAVAWPQGRFTQVEAQHETYVDALAQTVATIRDVVDAVRDPSSWTDTASE